MSDDTLVAIRERWRSVARYRVVVLQQWPWYKTGRELAHGLLWAEAEALYSTETARIALENPALSSWSRPMVTIELENEAEARAAVIEPLGNS